MDGGEDVERMWRRREDGGDYKEAADQLAVGQIHSQQRRASQLETTSAPGES